MLVAEQMGHSERFLSLVSSKGNSAQPSIKTSLQDSSIARQWEVKGANSRSKLVLKEDIILSLPSFYFQEGLFAHWIDF